MSPMRGCTAGCLSSQSFVLGWRWLAKYKSTMRRRARLLRRWMPRKLVPIRGPTLKAYLFSPHLVCEISQSHMVLLILFTSDYIYICVERWVSLDVVQERTPNRHHGHHRHSNASMYPVNLCVVDLDKPAILRPSLRFKAVSIAPVVGWWLCIP